MGSELQFNSTELCTIWAHLNIHIYLICIRLKYSNTNHYYLYLLFLSEHHTKITFDTVPIPGYQVCQVFSFHHQIVSLTCKVEHRLPVLDMQCTNINSRAADQAIHMVGIYLMQLHGLYVYLKGRHMKVI